MVPVPPGRMVFMQPCCCGQPVCRNDSNRGPRRPCALRATTSATATSHVEHQAHLWRTVAWARLVRSHPRPRDANLGPCSPATALQSADKWYPLLFRPDTHARDERQAPVGHPLQYWKSPRPASDSVIKLSRFQREEAETIGQGDRHKRRRDATRPAREKVHKHVHMVGEAGGDHPLEHGLSDQEVNFRRRFRSLGGQFPKLVDNPAKAER